MCDVNYVTLFDMDGVILLNRNIHSRVADRSVQFMRKKLPKHLGKKVDRKLATYINSVSYTHLGHSCLLFGNDKENIIEYNTFVFDNDMIDFIHCNINEKDRDYYEKVSNEVEKASIENVGLFTNTPFCYCEAVLNSLNRDSYFTEKLLSLAFTSDDGLIKPLPTTYDHVENKLKTFNDIHFLDDSLKNIVPLENRDHWFTQLIKSENDIMNYLQTELDYLGKIKTTKTYLRCL